MLNVVRLIGVLVFMQTSSVFAAATSVGMGSNKQVVDGATAATMKTASGVTAAAEDEEVAAPPADEAEEVP